MDSFLSDNRVEFINFGSDPTRNMNLLLDSLSPSTIVPEPNKYYTFVYKAKTPRIQYDMFPLVLCGSLFPWGFSGYNVHWGAVRQYSFGEIKSNLYELSEEEFSYLQDVPLAKYKTT